MTLLIEEIKPGIVAYMSAIALRADARVDMDPCADDPKEGRPYLCVSVTDAECTWLPLTSRDPMGTRLHLLPEWRLGGSRLWLMGRLYIQSFDRACYGPPEAFINASRPCDTVPSWNRPRIRPEGVAVVLRGLEGNPPNRRGRSLPQNLHSDRSETTR